MHYSIWSYYDLDKFMFHLDICERSLESAGQLGIFINIHINNKNIEP